MRCVCMLLFGAALPGLPAVQTRLKKNPEVLQVITDPWLRNFIDLECFVLSGMLAKDTITAEMAFMFEERNKPDSTIDYPMGGSAALVDALVRGIIKNGGKVMLKTPVEQIVMEQGRAVGVRLKSNNGTAEVCTEILIVMHN